jgi:hypothetical protein
MGESETGPKATGARVASRVGTARPPVPWWVKGGGGLLAVAVLVVLVLHLTGNSMGGMH